MRPGGGLVLEALSRSRRPERGASFCGALDPIPERSRWDKSQGLSKRAPLCRALGGEAV